MNHNDNSDGVGKRKAWDLDVVMEDGETMMKKSCLGNDTELDLIDTIQAGTFRVLIIARQFKLSIAGVGEKDQILFLSWKR